MIEGLQGIESLVLVLGILGDVAWARWTFLCNIRLFIVDNVLRYQIFYQRVSGSSASPDRRQRLDRWKGNGRNDGARRRLLTHTSKQVQKSTRQLQYFTINSFLLSPACVIEYFDKVLAKLVDDEGWENDPESNQVVVSLLTCLDKPRGKKNLPVRNNPIENESYSAVVSHGTIPAKVFLQPVENCLCESENCRCESHKGCCWPVRDVGQVEIENVENSLDNVHDSLAMGIVQVNYGKWGVIGWA